MVGGDSRGIGTWDETREARRRGGRAAVAAGLHLLLAGVAFTLLSVAPGWGSVDYLTPEAGEVVPLVYLGLALLVGHAVLTLAGAGRVVRLVVEVALAAACLAALGVLATAFPFDFADYWVDWADLVRILTWIGLFACLLWLLLRVVDLVMMSVSALRRSGSDRGRTRV